MERDRQGPYRPTYRVAKALAAVAIDLATRPAGVRFSEARARIEAVSGATSGRSFRRYLRALEDLFDGRDFPKLVIDSARETMKLEEPPPPQPRA